MCTAAQISLTMCSLARSQVHHCMENMFLGDCKQTDWWHSISLMEEKQGPANWKKLGEVKCHKGCGILFIDKRHDPLQKMCWQPTGQGDWVAQLPHGFSLLQQHAPFAFSPFLTSQPSQSLRFPMNVSPVPCRIGQQWRWNCELFELFESKEKFGLGAMSRGAHIPGFSPFYSNRLAARNLPSFNWIHWLNPLLAKYSSSIYFVLGLTSTLDGCPICNACDDLLRIRIAVMGIGILLWQETRCRLSQGRGGGMQVVLQKCYRGQASVTV